MSRISLAEQHKTNFEEIGIVSYQDVEQREYNDCKNLVIQVDSIIHLDPTKLKNTIVCLDEINSLLDYVLNSSTLVNRRLQVYNMLCAIVTTASYVIGVDADLSDIVTMFFKNFNITPYVIHNTFKIEREGKGYSVHVPKQTYYGHESKVEERGKVYMLF